MAEAPPKRKKGGGAAPRVCLCVLMNHPFPQHLPLLRRIYSGRFSEVRFLIPFERLPDADVITVYRGSYVHAAYVTDAWPVLRAIDCDYFLFVHDDVLLNPKLDETNFATLFPLGSDDAFIPQVCCTPERIGDWVWYYALLPKLLHSKSLLFGSGIEAANLLAHLPSAEAIRAGFVRSGASFAETVKMELEQSIEPSSVAHGVVDAASQVLLDGLSAQLDHAAVRQQAVDTRALGTLSALTGTLSRAALRDGHDGKPVTVDLPIPLAESGFYTDCYILPRSRLPDFAHYMGVAGAANLFVEIMVPVLLHAICDRVWTADTLHLDFTGFVNPRRLAEFESERVVASHPFKLSMFRTDAQRDAFVAMVQTLRRNATLTPDMATDAGLDASHGDTLRHHGWHALEHWGRWAAAPTALIQLNGAGPGGTVRLELTAPTTEDEPQLGGSVAVNGGPPRPFMLQYPASILFLDVGEGLLPANGPVTIAITSDRLIRPSAVDPASPDDRLLGVGLRRYVLL